MRGLLYVGYGVFCVDLPYCIGIFSSYCSIIPVLTQNNLTFCVLILLNARQKSIRTSGIWCHMFRVGEFKADLLFM